MRCEAGVCLGSGREAECTLDPVPFAEAQPSLELSWGTQVTTDYPNPYPEFSNVAQTTLVANLDDDNLDGEINEFDFPEIIFVGGKITDPFDGSAPTEPSVLRVLRGGGPERGKTILAVCGEQVWREGDPVEGLSCEANEHTHYRVFGTMAVGDLDADGVPEIVAMLKDSASGGGYVKVRVISPDGEILLDSAPINTASGDVGNLAASIADIDGDGMSEVLVGGYLLSLGKDAGTGDWFVRETFAPAPSTPLGIACVGDFTDDPGQEWFEGMALWRKPAKPDDRASRADCDGSETGESAAWCAGESIAVWDKRGELTTVGNDARSWRGVCAVADVWGASGPPSAPGDLDEVPELVLIGEEELILLDAETGDLLHREDLPARAVPADGVSAHDLFPGRVVVGLRGRSLDRHQIDQSAGDAGRAGIVRGLHQIGAVEAGGGVHGDHHGRVADGDRLVVRWSGAAASAFLSGAGIDEAHPVGLEFVDQIGLG